MRCPILLRAIVLLLPVLITVTSATADERRYELGRRTREMERAWDRQADESVRRAITPQLQKAVQAFFAMKVDEAARTMDVSRRILEKREDASPEVQWAEALYVTPSGRLLDTAADAFSLKLAPFYDPQAPLPEGTSVKVLLLFKGGISSDWFREQYSSEVTVPLESLPAEVEVPIKPRNLTRASNEGPGFTPARPVRKKRAGEYLLRVSIIRDKEELAVMEQQISLADDLDKRLEKLQAAVAELPEDNKSIESLTAVHLAQMLKKLAAGETLESNFPAERLLGEAERAATAAVAGELIYTADHPGEYWLVVPTANGPQIVRAWIPRGITADSPAPLVVALHGAGGSENMFFDAYGDGRIKKLAQRNNWILVATRSPSFGLVPVAALVDSLAQRLPINEEAVFLVGHSMGAAQMMVAALEQPNKYAGVAALGGGGVVPKSATPEDLPILVGIGSEDFALSRARKLVTDLEKVGAKQVTLQEYPEIEHLAIVHAALDDVFEFFIPLAEAASQQPQSSSDPSPAEQP